MTDIFHRLAARAQGRERQLRPQVQGLFEPQGFHHGDYHEGRGHDGFVELIEETVPQPGRRHPAEPSERPPGGRPQVSASEAPAVTSDTVSPAPPPDSGAALRPRATAAPDGVAETAPPGAPRSADNLAPRPQDDGPGAALRRASLPIAEPPTAIDESRIVGLETETSRGDGAKGRSQAEKTMAPAARRAAGPGGPGEPLRHTGQADGRLPSFDAAGAKPAPAAGASQLQPLAAARRLAEAEDPALPAWRPQAGRQVHIHIDHIEVRQQTRPAAEPAKRNRPANPAPDLNAYLRRRS